MNKKIIVSAGLTLVILLSAGVFTRIALPADNLPKLISGCTSGSVFQDLLSYIRTDLLVVLAFFFFARSAVLLPINFLIVACKAYALGFTAAHLMLTQSFILCLAVLLPRSLIKIPVYAYLLLIGFDKSKNTKIRSYFAGFGILLTSSFLEVLIIQVLV